MTDEKSMSAKRPKLSGFNFVRDRETGIVMIYMRRRKRGETTHHSKEVAPGWIVDYGIIDIEVLNPSRHFPGKILKLLPPEFKE